MNSHEAKVWEMRDHAYIEDQTQNGNAAPFRSRFVRGALFAADLKRAQSAYEEADKSSEDYKHRLKLLQEAQMLLPANDSELRTKILGKECWLTEFDNAAAAIPFADQWIPKSSGLSLADLHVCRGYALEEEGNVEEAGREYDFGVREARSLIIIRKLEVAFHPGVKGISNVRPAAAC